MPRKRPSLLGDIKEEMKIEPYNDDNAPFNQKELFSDIELQGIQELKKEADHVEVICGITIPKYGDHIGKLKIYPNAPHLVIDCLCFPGCDKENLRVEEFTTHIKEEPSSKYWREHLWVNVSSKKIPIWHTSLLKYYKKTWKGHEDIKGPRVHRDEFITCSKCKKERRFHLRSKEEFRAYHDALINPNWTCSQYKYRKMDCKSPKERVSGRAIRGCQKETKCMGCTSCVCCGCIKCRYSDCSCRICRDFFVKVVDVDD